MWYGQASGMHFQGLGWEMASSFLGSAAFLLTGKYWLGLWVELWSLEFSLFDVLILLASAYFQIFNTAKIKPKEL